MRKFTTTTLHYGWYYSGLQLALNFEKKMS